MITNWAEGSMETGSLEQIFYIAVQLQVPRRSNIDTEWQSLAEQPGQLARAYRLALQERENLVRQAGLLLVQDLHLLDAEANLIDDEPDDEQTKVLHSIEEPHPVSVKASSSSIN